MNDNDKYDLFFIEYHELVLDIYDDIKEYCNDSNINFYMKEDVGSFMNIIYNNIDYINSSEIIDNMRKNYIRDLEYEENELLEEDEILFD